MNMLNSWKQKQLNKIMTKQHNNILNENDLFAGKQPSFLFYILADRFGYLLSNEPDKVLSSIGVRVRKLTNIIIKVLGPMFLLNTQVMENRKSLIDPTSTEVDEKINLPNKPVIWVANHAFKDDTLASILAIKRNAYIMFGSLPQFYNTFDGVTAWLNGVVMTNRKVKESKRASIQKAVKAMELGADIFMFPEGVWNKSPNALLIDFWPGVYRLAKETGADIIPVVHYISEPSKIGKDNVIHTVVDDPISISSMEEDNALELIKEKMGTWFFLMMERYGQSTRSEVLNEHDTSVQAWENHLIERVTTADRYDLEIELCADYRPKNIIRAEDVFENIANIENITVENASHIVYASQIVKTCQENDFQRRF